MAPRIFEGEPLSHGRHNASFHVPPDPRALAHAPGAGLFAACAPYRTGGTAAGDLGAKIYFKNESSIKSRSTRSWVVFRQSRIGTVMAARTDTLALAPSMIGLRRGLTILVRPLGQRLHGGSRADHDLRPATHSNRSAAKPADARGSAGTPLTRRRGLRTATVACRFSRMQIEFAGAAREVTGSCHIVRAKGRTILLDCGLFQGKRQDADAKNRTLPCPIDEIDAVVLSHAHLDHAGRLPFLTNRGYAEADLRDASDGRPHRDHARRQRADSGERLRVPDAPRSRRKSAALRAEGRGDGRGARADATVRRVVRRGSWHSRTLHRRRPHPRGRRSVVVEATENGKTSTLVFSGDVGRAGLPIIRDPDPPKDAADLVILESTYGDRDHESVAEARNHLARVVRETAARGGRVLIPAFAVGRAQELVYDLHVLFRAQRDSRDTRSSSTARSRARRPTSSCGIPISTITPKRRSARPKTLFEFDLLTRTNTADESKALNTRVGPDDHHRRLGHGRGWPHPAPPDARRVEFAEHDSHRRLSGRAHARPPHRRAAADAQDPRRDASSCARRWRS